MYHLNVDRNAFLFFFPPFPRSAALSDGLRQKKRREIIIPFPYPLFPSFLFFFPFCLFMFRRVWAGKERFTGTASFPVPHLSFLFLPGSFRRLASFCHQADERERLKSSSFFPSLFFFLSVRGRFQGRKGNCRDVFSFPFFFFFFFSLLMMSSVAPIHLTLPTPGTGIRRWSFNSRALSFFFFSPFFFSFFRADRLTCSDFVRGGGKKRW